jgi:hypothetical protein
MLFVSVRRRRSPSPRSEHSESRSQQSRRFLVPIVAFALVVSACTGGSVAPPAEVDSCTGLVLVGIDLVERWVENVEGLPVNVMVGDVEPPQEIADLIATGSELDQRAGALGCGLVELNGAIAEGTAALETDDPAAALVLKIVRESSFVTPPEGGEG